MARIKTLSLSLSFAALLVACGGAVDSGSEESPNNLGAAGTSGGAQAGNGQAGNAQAGNGQAANGGVAGGGGQGFGNACHTVSDCPVPAVACSSSGGSPYMATCIDGVCGLDMVGCPSPGKNCGIWGCCETVSDCKAVPAVGPCPDGSSSGEMACDAGACTYHPKTCQTPGAGGSAGSPGSAGAAGACPSDPPAGAMGFGLTDACQACASQMTGLSVTDPTVDCGAADATCQGDCGCKMALNCFGAQIVVNGKSPNCAVAACDEPIKKAATSTALLTCLKEQCPVACGFTVGGSTCQ